MNFSQFCKGLHSRLSGISNQGQLVGSLFHAAGSNFFPARPAYNTDSYQRKLYGGTKPLTQEMKDSFPIPIDADSFKAFLQTRIGEASLTQIMANFSVPVGEVQDKATLAAALCIQFQSIVSDAANDVDDIVASEYCRLLRESGTESVSSFPFYRGDNMQLVSETPEAPHNVRCYELFEHTWIIRNTGKVTWEGRRLECTDHAKIRIKALVTVIDIPRVKPGGDVYLTAKFDARGIEGTFESVWEMRDGEGHSCFPNQGKALKTIATVTHERSAAAEV